MSQYRTGTITITSGETIIMGQGTAWTTAGVVVGDSIKKKGENALYTIANVSGESQILLTSPYNGSGEISCEYQIVRDRTANLGLTEIYAGDIDWPWHLTEGVIRKLDTYLSKYGRVTLEANVDHTDVSHSLVTANSHVFLTPRSWSAAQEMASGELFVTGETIGVGFTIYHHDKAVDDRTYDYIIMG